MKMKGGVQRSHEEYEESQSRKEGRQDVAKEVLKEEVHEEVRHVVLFSGGVGSWAAAKRVAAQHGTDGLVLLFTDTKSEDEDTYRFLKEGAENVGGRLVWLADGRDIWQVYEDEGIMGSTRIDLCSRILKRELSKKWVHENCGPEIATVYVGIDWSEDHRFRRMARYWQPFTVEAPLTEPPYLTKNDLIAWAESEGVRNQRLYEEGFRHANCGGFCIKMGHAGARHLLRMRPKAFAYHEERERRFRERVGKNVSILRDRTGGDTKPLTLEALRERVEAQDPIDEFDWGSCACVEPSEEEMA